MAEREHNQIQINRLSRNAIIQNSLMRWEGITVLMGSIVGTVGIYALGLLENIMALIPFGIGSTLYGVLVWSSVTDKRGNAYIREEIQIGHPYLQTIQSVRLRKQLSEALLLRKNIHTQIQQQIQVDPDALDPSMTSEQVDKWIDEIYDIATQLDTYLRSKKVEKKKRYAQSNKRYKQLTERLAQYPVDSEMYIQLQENLDELQRQMDSLKRLDDFMKKSQLKMEKHLLSMETMCNELDIIELESK